MTRPFLKITAQDATEAPMSSSMTPWTMGLASSTKAQIDSFKTAEEALDLANADSAEAIKITEEDGDDQPNFAVGSKIVPTTKKALR